MELNKTGGQAFPSSDVQTAHAIAAAAISGIEDSAERDRAYTDVRAQALQGMTLRDYFAAKAMVGVISTCEREPGGATNSLSAADIARASYEFADAMLAERAK